MSGQVAGGFKTGRKMAKAGCIYRGQRLIIAAGSLEPVVAKETVSVIRENSGRCLFEVAVCRGDQTQIGPGRASPEKIGKAVSAVSFRMIQEMFIRSHPFL